MKHALISTVRTLLLATALFLAACGGSPAATPSEPAQPTTAPTTEPTVAPAATDELQGTIAVSGAFALYPMMTIWADEFQKVHPGVSFDVQGGGAGKGMTDVLAGAVDIGMISRSIKPEEEEKGAFWVSVTKDAVFPIVSAQNPVAAVLAAKGISQEVFNKIYITGEYKTWGDVVNDPSITDEIHVFTRSDAAGAAEMWAKYSGGKAQEDLKGVGVNDEPALIDTVAKDPLGIGFANLGSVYDITTGNPTEGITIVPVDANANGTAEATTEIYPTKSAAVAAIAAGDYPSPPARFENLATKGKPTGLTLAFIQWILADGQQFLEPAGFVPLTPEQRSASKGKLEE